MERKKTVRRPRAKHPMQPIVVDKQNVARFKANAIVQYLLDAGPFDMNHLAWHCEFSREDREQFAQLIGYSVSGFGELGYASDAVYEAAAKEVARVWKPKKSSVRRG